MIHKVCQLHVYGDDLCGWRWEVRKFDGSPWGASGAVSTTMQGAVRGAAEFGAVALVLDPAATVHAVPAGWCGA